MFHSIKNGTPKYRQNLGFHISSVSRIDGAMKVVGVEASSAPRELLPAALQRNQ